MHDLCVEEGVPSIFLNGSSILQTGPVKYFNTGAAHARLPACRWRRAAAKGNTRTAVPCVVTDHRHGSLLTGNPAFKRMGGIKTLFVWELLNLGLQPVLTDADAVWCVACAECNSPLPSRCPTPTPQPSPARSQTTPDLRLRDPREYFQRGSLAAADVLVSSDCIEVPNDEQWRVASLRPVDLRSPDASPAIRSVPSHACDSAQHAGCHWRPSAGLSAGRAAGSATRR